jgi:ribosome-associated protein
MTSEPTVSGDTPRPVLVRDLPIELSQFLKFAGVAATGGEAKQLVADGRVTVNGADEKRKGRKLVSGDQVTVAGRTLVVQTGP